MADSANGWRGARGWGLDLAFAVAVGFCFGLIGPFGTFVEAPLPFRLVYWTALFAVGALIYGLAIRAALALGGRWRIPSIGWLLLLTALASAPMSLISYAVATHFWPALEAMSPFGWYSQSAAVSIPLVGVYGALTRRLWPLRRPLRHAQGAGRLPDPLKRGVICLQMEDHYVRVHTRAGSELVLLSMREAMAQLGARDGERVHRSWWVAREAVTDVVVDGRNLRLRLVGGLEAPVSRSQVGRLRSLGWLGGVDIEALEPTDEIA
jgi:hypothetical protein